MEQYQNNPATEYIYDTMFSYDFESDDFPGREDIGMRSIIANWRKKLPVTVMILHNNYWNAESFWKSSVLKNGCKHILLTIRRRIRWMKFFSNDGPPKSDTEKRYGNLQQSAFAHSRFRGFCIW